MPWKIRVYAPCLPDPEKPEEVTIIEGQFDLEVEKAIAEKVFVPVGRIGLRKHDYPDVAVSTSTHLGPDGAEYNVFITREYALFANGAGVPLAKHAWKSSSYLEAAICINDARRVLSAVV